jgi:hypothetical protein
MVRQTPFFEPWIYCKETTFLARQARDKHRKIPCPRKEGRFSQDACLNIGQDCRPTCASTASGSSADDASCAGGTLLTHCFLNSSLPWTRPERVLAKNDLLERVLAKNDLS